ncbi:Ig kappa chain V-IV region B17 [Sciurus carolinensis]|uniref:Ig kappa chain V-IV region B17 n=1 Tax=Sciurus carolinensis TaxID=30640 RepID=A0AA41T1L2_SCICA|nr:Ig kappa chain V-IV region B17 [Sciurus carolinensis]
MMTLAPGFLALSLGERVTISCKSIQSLLWDSDNKGYLTWTSRSQDRLLNCSPPGHPHEQLGYHQGLVTVGKEYISLSTISSFQAEDLADYYCQHWINAPPTVLLRL